MKVEIFSVEEDNSWTVDTYELPDGARRVLVLPGPKQCWAFYDDGRQIDGVLESHQTNVVIMG